MKFLFDLFPVILFFGTYKLATLNHPSSGACFASNTSLSFWQEPILLATLVAIAATFLQVGWLLLRRKRVDTMLWASLAIIVVFGGATLYFRNPEFIQWKPSVLYWSFGITLAFSALALKKNIIRSMMEQQLSLPDAAWARLNYSWAAFMILMGFVNIIAVRLLSCDQWVAFKLYGFTGLMLVFVIGQGLMLSKYMEPEKTAATSENGDDNPR